MTHNEQVFGKVLDKNVRSADGQLLNSCSIAQFLLDCPIVLRLPKLLPKESRIAQLLPSASTLLNTFVSCIPSEKFCPKMKLLRLMNALPFSNSPIYLLVVSHCSCLWLCLLL